MREAFVSEGFTAVENLPDYIFPIKFIILECKGYY